MGGYAPDVDGLAAAAQFELRQLQIGPLIAATVVSLPPQRLRHVAGKQNLARTGSRAEPRRDVDRITYQGNGLTPRRPECTDRDLTKMQPNADARLDGEIVAPPGRNGSKLAQYGMTGCQTRGSPPVV